MTWLVDKGDLMKAFIPHGVMVGAGLVALIQVVMLMMKQDSTATGTRTRLRRSAAPSSAAPGPISSSR